MMNHNRFPENDRKNLTAGNRRALDSLPERESKPVRRFSAKKIVCADWLPRCASAELHLLRMHRAGFHCCFRNGGDANLEGYVQTADNAG